MVRRLIRDESGMTMALSVIMVVLIGVMGAGLLTFVQRDLDSVIEVNRGQRALEAADAGVQAAKRQLASDNFDTRNHYDGGADDLAWSYCYQITGCTTATPTSTGSAGMRINMPNNDYANVTIFTTDHSVETYRVISDGRSGDARRKVEAIIRIDPPVTAPPVYMSRSDIHLTGSSNVDSVSFFALGNIDFPSGSFTLGNTADIHFGSWAATSGAGPYPNALGSYPNTFNRTARTTNLVGVGAQGFITGVHKANALEGIRSFDSDSTPYRVVPNYDASPLPPNQKIAFPFQVPTPGDDREEINALRDRALALEQANPGTRYYIDSNPGNGVDDPGLPNGAQAISTWPANSTYSTVVFYKYAAYDSANSVSYLAGDTSCGTTTNRGVIVVVNGDVSYTSNRRFDGGIFIRAYDASGNLMPDVGGLYNGGGNPCLYGYVNSSGDQVVTGNFTAGTTPELSRLTPFRGSMEMVSWRELYQ